MVRRAGLLTAFAVAVAACGGSSDEAVPVSVEVTLITAAPTTTETPLQPVDSAPDADDDTATDETDTEAGDAATSTVPESTAPESTVETTTTTTEPAGPNAAETFALETNGLGATAFGADPDGTITFVSSFLGPPTADTGWIDPFTIGPCGGTQLRQVNWGELRLEFGDVSNITVDRPHFYAYTYGREGSGGVVQPAGLTTADGLGLGTSVIDLLGLYPTVELRVADEFIAANFIINDSLTGRLSGLGDNGVVELSIGGLQGEG